MKTFAICLALVMGLMVSMNYAGAHGNATGVVKERMMAMEAIGASMKKLAALIRGKQPYDAAEVKKNALIIKAHGGENLLKLFPKGSTAKPSEARPLIWGDWDGFKAEAERLSETAGALAVAADKQTPGSGMMNGRTAMMTDGSSGPSAEQLSAMPPMAAFMHLAQTCKSCHKTYRQKIK